LQSRFGEKAETIEGSRGQFDVLDGDTLLFSKKEAGRFPNSGEVEERVSLLKRGEQLPPLAHTERQWFVSRLISRLTG
jgi:predicted Rdx family selenoprotein